MIFTYAQAQCIILHWHGLSYLCGPRRKTIFRKRNRQISGRNTAKKLEPLVNGIWHQLSLKKIKLLEDTIHHKDVLLVIRRSPAKTGKFSSKSFPSRFRPALIFS